MNKKISDISDKNKDLATNDYNEKIKNDPLFVQITHLVEKLEQKYGLTFSEILTLTKKPGEITLPLSIFKNKKLGILEIVTKFLKQEKNLRYNKIASLLNRNQRTIWSTYNLAIKKDPSHFKYEEDDIQIPISIFADRKFSPLESLTAYLKENLELSFTEISDLVERDQRNIWSTYHNHQLKRGRKNRR